MIYHKSVMLSESIEALMGRAGAFMSMQHFGGGDTPPKS